MRRPLKKKRVILPDSKFESELLGRFINVVMWDGKKSVAQDIVYGALEEIKKRDATLEPMVVFETAISNVSPTIEVRSRRVGGANYQVPREVRPERRRSLAFRWIVMAARAKKGKSMAEKLIRDFWAAFEQDALSNLVD